MSCGDELKSCFEDLIQKGNYLINILSEDPLVNIIGAAQLKRKVKQEISFLEKVLEKGLMKNEHVLCSNLKHLEAVVDKIQETSNVVALQKSFSFMDSSVSEEVKKISIDIVVDNGTKWIKVKSRNPKAISQIAAGDSSFGQKSMIDQAAEYLKCAQQNPAMFQPPRVCVHFAHGVEIALSNILADMNIDVSGNILPQNLNETTTFDDLDPPVLEDVSKCNKTAEKCPRGIEKLNLDVSTMIAFVSSLTNGGDTFSFCDPLLMQQAQWERQRPVTPILEKLFQGKMLIACQKAIDDFTAIIQTMAGEEETKRAQQLIQRIQVVPDTPTEKARALTMGGKIKNRSINIFGTGDFHGAMTVTANSGFIRSAQSQGVEFVVCIHESRALTEKKQILDAAS